MKYWSTSWVLYKQYIGINQAERTNLVRKINFTLWFGIAVLVFLPILLNIIDFHYFTNGNKS